VCLIVPSWAVAFCFRGGVGVCLLMVRWIYRIEATFRHSLLEFKEALGGETFITELGEGRKR